MNTFQLRCFLAAANTLNFARAAEQMNVSQPAITHQIKTLENELNVKLFHRSTRVVEITPEGQAFMTDAKSMLAIEEQAKIRFSNPEDRPLKTLSIGCSSYTQLDLLTDILNELLQVHPNLHPRLFVVPHGQLFHLLETDAADVVFDIREVADPKAGLTFKEIRQSALVCACRENYLPDGKESITIQELGKEKLIFCDPITLDSEIAKLQWKLVEGRNPVDIHFCSSSEASVTLAGAGFGLAILPELFVPQKKNMVKIKIEEAPRLSFGMFYQSSPGDSVLRDFIQITKRHFSDPV